MPLKSSPQALVCLFIGCYLMALHPNNRHQVNTPPKVFITKPSGKERFNWNSMVRYTINISDLEDGQSAYNEIAPHEVILKTAFLPDSSKAQAYISNEIKTSAQEKGLSLIKTSTCFNCHTLKTKLIGPSFEAISKRYSGNQDSIKWLANKIIKGSKMVWGITEMPPNPEIKMEDAREIVQWLLKNSTNPQINYLPGLEGAFRTIPKPSNEAGKGVYILTASYTDHGVPQTPNQYKKGKDVMVMKSN